MLKCILIPILNTLFTYFFCLLTFQIVRYILCVTLKVLIKNIARLACACGHIKFDASKIWEI